MSLDVYLKMDYPVSYRGGSGIFIRENGATREISREEWDLAFPGREPVVVKAPEDEVEHNTRVYHANITHNLNRMATEAGIYEPLWRPEEIGITRAEQLLPPLEEGLARLEGDPARFIAFNPENGWGSYEGLVEFVKNYLAACREYPEAKVTVWR